MPMWPTRFRMSRVRNTSRTRPGPLCMWKLWPSAVTIPAASWPRCCRTVMPSYSSWFTGLRATTPTMPHMLGSPKASDGGDRAPVQSGSWQRHHLRGQAALLQFRARRIGGLARGKRSGTKPCEPARRRVEALRVVRDAGGGELLARLLELRLVAEGADLD